MTEEGFRSFIRASGLVAVAVGAFGSMLCVPYALTTSLSLISTAGTYFIAGGVMIVGGLLTVALLIQPQK